MIECKCQCKKVIIYLFTCVSIFCISHEGCSKFEHPVKKPVEFDESRHSTVCRCSAEGKGAVKKTICSVLSVLSSQSSLIFSAALLKPTALKKKNDGKKCSN